MSPNDIFCILESRRRELNMPYHILAAKAGMTTDNARKILHGIHFPRLNTLDRLTFALGMTIEVTERGKTPCE